MDEAALSFSVPCLVCGDEASDCEACGGVTPRENGCPYKYAAGVNGFLEAFDAMEVFKVLPESGGWLDQPAVFVQAARHARTQIEKWKRRTRAR